jgi:hypothetical protein
MSCVGTEAYRLTFAGMMLKAGLAILLLPVGLSAPAVMGTLRGRITDNAGVPVAKALIAVISSRGAVKVGTSNAQGEYAIHDLDPGRYTLWAAQRSLSLFESAQLGIDRGQVEPVDIKLSISSPPPEGLPASRESRVNLASLEAAYIGSRPAKPGVCQTIVSSESLDLNREYKLHSEPVTLASERSNSTVERVFGLPALVLPTAVSQTYDSREVERHLAV